MLVKHPPAVQHIIKQYALAGIEIAGFDESGSWISLTLPVDFEDLTDLLLELKQDFRLEADYRYCSDSKTATLLLTELDPEPDASRNETLPSESTNLLLLFSVSVVSAGVAIAALIATRTSATMQNHTIY
jgi:hypothetical protein